MAPSQPNANSNANGQPSGGSMPPRSEQTTAGRGYVLQSVGQGERFLTDVEQRFETRPGRGVAMHHLTYLDTFDWRLYHDQGAMVAERRNGDGLTIHWRSFDGAPRHQVGVKEVPGFAHELAASGFRRDLTEVIEMRRLLPMVEVVARGQTIEIVDPQGQTRCRLSLRNRQAATPGPGTQHTRPLEPVLWVSGPIGQDLPKKLRRLIREHGLAEETDQGLATALAAVGQRPSSYSSKLRVSLDPQMPAQTAMSHIYLRLLETMRHNESGVRADIDSEFLHDFRVAVRRTRSGLAQVRKIFSPDVLEHFAGEFRWLGQVTGPTRDLDVYLLKMDGFRAQLPESDWPHLDGLEEYLLRHQRMEQRKVREHLDSERYRRLVVEWEQQLQQPAPPKSDKGRPRNAARSIGKVASRRLSKLSRKTVAAGNAIDDATPAAALHDLRLQCKKLRYLMEFFRSLYPPQKIVPLIKSLKPLQDNLGDFNDLVVQQERLTHFGRDMAKEGLGDPDTLLAMGRLVARLEEEQVATRQRFARRFARFGSEANCQVMRVLFG